MSDNLMRQNRLKMRNSYRVKVGTGIENHYYMSYLSATLQALFACEKFRVKLILFAEEYKIPNTRFHTHLSDLYMHMVIGKEAFVIPGLKDLTTQLSLPNWQEINPKHLIDTTLESLHILYQFYMRAQLAAEVTVDKCPTQPFLGQKTLFCKSDGSCRRTPQNALHQQLYWTTPINSGAQPLQCVIEDEVKLFAKTAYDLAISGCEVCGGHKVCGVWQSPAILILALIPSENQVAIQYTITIDSELNLSYSLFAYVCKHVLEEHYNCCTKFGEQWTYFDGKIAEEITKPVTNLTNVCLMFYERNGSADITQYSEIVDKLISDFVKDAIKNKSFDFEIDSQMRFANLFQPQSQFRPLRETTLSLNPSVGLVNVETMCYLNSTIQSLYACRLFRKYVMECDQSFGPFHTVFKSLFSSMKANDRDSTHNYHIQLYQLYYPSHHFNRTMFCFLVFLLQLHRECINFGSAEVIDVRMSVTAPLVDPIDYVTIYCGREDLSSISSWNRHVIAEHNSYITNLFTKQLILSQRCKFGHKCEIKFAYEYVQSVPQFYYQNCDSLQQIVHLICRCAVYEAQYCNRCSPDSNEWYLYDRSISRVSNILAFNFDLISASESIENWQSFGKIGVHLNEYLVVCGQTYRCMAWTVNEQRVYGTLGHNYAHCLCDDGYWYRLNDMNVTRIEYGMPQESDIAEPKSAIDMAFYERVFDSQQSVSRPRSGSQFTCESIVGFTNSSDSRSYMNSVIQCLYRCSKFRNYILHEQRAIEVMVEEPVIAYTHQTLKRLFDSISSNNWQTIDSTDTWFSNQFTEKHSEYVSDEEVNPRDFLWQLITDLLNEDNGLMYDTDSKSNMESERILNDAWNQEIVLSWSEYINSHVVEMFYVITQYNMFCSQTETHNKISCTSDIKLELTMPSNTVATIISVQSLVNEYLLRSKRDTIECEHCNQTENPYPNDNANANVAHLLKFILRTPDILVIQFDSIEPNIWQLFETGCHIDVDKHLIVYEQNYIFRACICCVVSTQEDYNNNYEPQYQKYSYHFNVYVIVDHVVYCIDDRVITPLPQTQPQPSAVLQQLKNVFIVFYEKN